MDQEAKEQLVKELAEFGTSEQFSSAISTFMQAHCEAFKGGTADGEQKLEFYDIYKKYTELVDKLLDDFCSERQMQTTDVFNIVGEVIADVEKEFIPEFILNSEYGYFVEQMCTYANQSDTFAVAKSQAEGDNICGMWETWADKSDYTKLPKMLEILKCPKFFRPIAVHAAKNTKNIAVVLDGNEFKMSYSIRFFGKRQLIIKTDGKTYEVTNVWRAKVKQTSSYEGGVLKSHVKGSGRPDNVMSFEVEEDGSLAWKNTVVGGDNLSYTLYFKRAT